MIKFYFLILLEGHKLVDPKTSRNKSMPDVCKTPWTLKQDVQPEVILYIGRGVYVYSAYYDGRDDTVKVTALVPSVFHSKLYCLLWYKEREHPQVVEVNIHTLDQANR